MRSGLKMYMPLDFGNVDDNLPPDILKERVLRRAVENCDFSNATTSTLRISGITTLGQVVQHTEKQLADIGGREMVRDIKSALQAINSEKRLGGEYAITLSATSGQGLKAVNDPVRADQTPGSSINMPHPR